MTIAADSLPNDVLRGDTEWRLDIAFNADATRAGKECIFGNGDGNNNRFDVMLNSDGTMAIGDGGRLGSGWTADTDWLLTIESYFDASDWRFVAYRNGVVVNNIVWAGTNVALSNIYIGHDGGDRYFTGTVRAVRIGNKAVHRGVAFTPEPQPWLPPAKAIVPVGVSELADLLIATGKFSGA